MPGLPVITASTCAPVGPLVHLAAGDGVGDGRVVGGVVVAVGYAGTVATGGAVGSPVVGSPPIGRPGTVGTSIDGTAEAAEDTLPGGPVGSGRGGDPHPAGTAATSTAGTSRSIR
jgi:hypothetical protein